MSKNKVLLFTSLLTKTVFFFSVLIYLLFILVISHWHFNQSFYEHWYLKNGFQAGLDSFHINITEKDSEGISLSKLSHSMIYWLLLRTSIILFLVLTILRKLLNIIKSISSLQTFYDHNIKTFKSLSIIGFILSGIGFFNFGIVDGITNVHFTIPFGSLLFSAACLVLAEVFKEGKKLLDDSNAIV